jgi:hypothetical protein
MLAEVPRECAGHMVTLREFKNPETPFLQISEPVRLELDLARTVKRNENARTLACIMLNGNY